jgi:photosystem II stability/assembly factor-like uncharacterized protein
MKKLLFIIGIPLLAYSCQKKEEQPQPAKVESFDQKSQSLAIDTTIGMVKITVWSNRKNYIYRRRHIYQKDPIRIRWQEDSVKTNTKVFYETYYDKQEGSLNHLEYALLATHSLSYIKGDSTRITAEYEGKKTTDLNLSGQTFAIIYLEDLK